MFPLALVFIFFASSIHCETKLCDDDENHIAMAVPSCTRILPEKEEETDKKYDSAKFNSFLNATMGKREEEPPLFELVQKKEVEVVVAKPPPCCISPPCEPIPCEAPPPPCCCTPNCPPYGSTVFPFYPVLEWRIGSGRSYSRGYQAIRGFLAAYNTAYLSYPFLDIRAHRVDKGRLATNLGFGWRVFSPCFDQMFGLNIFHDYRRVRNHGNFQQIGLGGEIFVRCWQMRINGYIPIGRKKTFINSQTFSFPDGTPFSIMDEFEGPMRGMDLEIGRSFRYCCLDFFVGIGPYFYSGECFSFFGGWGRVGVRACNCFRASIYFSYDRCNRTKLQGEIGFWMSLPCCLDCVKCLFPPIFRNDIILTEEFCEFQNNF